MPKHLKHTDIIKINDYLKGVLYKKDGQQYWTYRDALTDKLVAEKLGTGITTLINLRLELFGSIGPAANKVTYEVIKAVDEFKAATKHFEHMQAQLTTLETKNYTLQNQLEELIGKYNRLCQNLTLNRVVDVHHLEINNKEVKPNEG